MNDAGVHDSWTCFPDSGRRLPPLGEPAPILTKRVSSLHDSWSRVAEASAWRVVRPRRGQVLTVCERRLAAVQSEEYAP